MTLHTNVQGRVSVPVSDPFDPNYVVSPGGAQDAVVGVFNTASRGSGSIIGDGQWVLTAAHVIFGESAEAMSIAVDLPSGRVFIDVAEYIIHPDYTPDNTGFSSANDIALIRLAERAPIAGFDIYRASDELSAPFSLIGYGVAGTGAQGIVSNDPGSGTTKRTGQNQYEIIDGDGSGIDDLFGEPTADGSLLFYDFDNGTAENDVFGNLYDINNTGLGANEVSATPGDSGGPTLINDQIAGLVSGGARFTGSESPDIDGSLNSSFGEIGFDTRVSFFQSWIDGIVGNIFDDGLNPGDPIDGSPIDPTDPTDPVTPPPVNIFPLPLPGVQIEMPSSDPITAPPSDLPDDELVFRFFNTTSGAHFYTASEAERDNIIATLPEFVYEAPVFEAGEPFFPGSVEVFRLFNTVNGGHLYTTSQSEIAAIQQNLPQFQLEGPVFRVSAFATGNMDPVYRFFNFDNGTHFYTINEAEKDLVQATMPNMSLDGIAWYAIPV